MKTRKEVDFQRGRCPNCGAEHAKIHYDDYDMDDGSVVQPARCGVCDQHWYEVYELDRYECYDASGSDDTITVVDVARLEGRRPDVTPLLAALQDLLEWADRMGGWEAPVWERAKSLIAGYP